MAGAALLAWSAALHLYLWSDYFHRIHTIGPLFMLQGIIGVTLAAAVVTIRSAVIPLIGSFFLASTAGGLLLSVWIGLFGYHERLGAPYAGMTLVIEFSGAALLILLTGVRLGSRRANRRPSPRSY